MNEGYPCQVCGHTMILEGVEREWEMWTCPKCGSMVTFRYVDEGIHMIVWDDLAKQQYRLFYDWNTVMNKLEKMMPVVFKRADKLK